MGEGDNIQYHSLPIPSYEEAINARPSSSQAHRGATEVSDDAERQGLMGRAPLDTPARRHDGYQAPTVESERNSIDSDLYLPEVTEDEENASLRRDMEELEIDDSATRRSAFAKHFNFSYLTSRLPSLPSFSLCPNGCCSCFRLPDNFRISIPVVARLIGLALIALFVWSVLKLSSMTSRRHFGQRFEPESVRQLVQGTADEGRIGDYLRYIASFDHVAGTEGDLYLAQWIEQQWKVAGMEDVGMEEYFAYLNYPTAGGGRVKIVEPAIKEWEAPLDEPTAMVGLHTQNWLAHSRNGSATGHLIFANGGSRADFEKLKELGVQVNGSVVLMRQQHTQRDMALKVKAAELAGVVACLLYSDPKETSLIQGVEFPQGPWRPLAAVQRGDVGLTDWILGDPLTAGQASVEDAKGDVIINNPGLVNIPSQAISADAAYPLLLAMQTHGQQVPADWAGGIKEVSWWTGDTSGPKVLVENFQDENDKQRIWNVQGQIKGMGSDHRVIVGNHRDSWCRGAADPGTGTAVMMEVVGLFGKLREQGWRPLRTIEFHSWDAKDYGMIGSTEHVEQQPAELRADTLAYLNVDVGATGTLFRAAASPEWSAPLLRVLDRIRDPNTDDKTLRDLFLERQGNKLDLLDSRSDYVPFRDIVGAASIDMGFTAGPGKDYPRGSCWDNIEWMEQFGDPGSTYARTLAQIWALLILEVADRPVAPFDLRPFAAALRDDWMKDLESFAAGYGVPLIMDNLAAAAGNLSDSVAEFQTFEDQWTSQVMGLGGFETDRIATDRAAYNDRMMGFQKDLLDLPGYFDGDDKQSHGIPGREQYKHIIFGPAAWTNSSGADTFAAVKDAIADGDAKAAQERADKAAAIIARAAARLLAP